ncbi:neutral zinc metallopeptidase [soil metagenome]
MAYWDKLTGSGNVEDRRASGPLALGGGAGLIGVAIVMLFNFLSTGNPPDLNSVLQQLQQPAGVQQQSGDSSQFAGVDDYEKFTSTVLGSTNNVWREVFKQNNKTYQEPRLVLFRSATQSGCGVASSDVGPHYCPADATIYIDETFFDELKRLGGSNSDVAQAYVIAHEVGHHVQNELGTYDAVKNTGSSENKQSVELELQADCFAGIWAHSVSALGVFEPGEIKEATDTAAAVGDDRVQKTITGKINPESWTHGSSAQRVQWFNTGLSSGNPSTCSTFNE